MATTTGVYPVYENQFKIDKTGGDGATEGNLTTIADMERFSVSIAGNDYVDGLALKTGKDATTTLVWTFPSGAKLTIKGVVSVTDWGGGDSTNVAPLAFDFASDGKPTFTEATA